MISALEGCDALLEEMYRSIASGWTRMEVLIPHAPARRICCGESALRAKT
jgi:hypothetical protein